MTESTAAPNTAHASSWYTLQDRQSLGATRAKVAHQGEWAARRTEILAQYFTPAPLASFVWRCVAPAMQERIEKGETVTLFDNSIGTGRLCMFAHPAHHRIAGADVHAPSIEALEANLTAAGFRFDLVCSGMEAIAPRGFDIALINPPFGMHLETPTLQPLPATTLGRFGPNTSAVSHEYALAQALDAAHLVVAIMPRTWVDRIAETPWATRKLVHVFHAPPSSFREEGTDVAVSVLVFDKFKPTGRGHTVNTLESLDVDPRVCMKLPDQTSSPKPLSRLSQEASTPSILLPVTGDARVRVFRHRAELRLAYRCGLVQAKVANALLRADVSQPIGAGAKWHRYPRGIRFQGQGQLDLEILALQANPDAALRQVLQTIRAAGGVPDLDPGLLPYFRKLLRRRALERTALSHTVFVENGGDVRRQVSPGQRVTATARRRHVIDSSVWGSPLVDIGSTWTFQREANAAAETYVSPVPKSQTIYRLTRDELLERFDVAELNGAPASGWVKVAEGREAAFPLQAHAARARLARVGADAWLSWGFQRTDVAEAAMTRGSLIGACMGAGKTRQGVALAMMGGLRNLIVVEAHVLGEWQDELRAVGVPDAQWQVIQSPQQALHLCRLNLITFDRVRRPLYPGASRRTYASVLRGRINSLIVDEAHCLANTTSLQVQALQEINAKRRYLLTGTPIGNYPRDLLAIGQFVLGQGTAAQPYGRYRPYIEERLFASMDYAQRGGDAFRESFCVMEWSTNEFDLSDMQRGAKREVPKLNRLSDYRAFAGRVVKRRVREEPEVAAHIQIPPPSRQVVTVPWKPEHLAMYLNVAEDFANWFRAAKEAAGMKGHQVNLISLLAHINAVVTANNCPQRGVGQWRYGGLTAKDDAILAQLLAFAGEGRKTICYAANPMTIDIYQRELDRAGTRSTLIHGGVGVNERHQRIAKEFKNGKSPILLATLGVSETGLNIPQADAVIFNARSWSPRTESQAEARTLRPQQKRSVEIRRYHHEGSIDLYQATMVEMKADSARAGLDWATPEHDETPWLHWQHILGAFLDGIAGLRGVPSYAMRKEIRHAA